MTRGEKLRQARETMALSPIELDEKMRRGPGFIISLESGRLTMDDTTRGWLEMTLGMVAGGLRGDDEDAGHDVGADADGGSDGGDRPHGGGPAAAQAH